jgi:hypothetical protein
MPSDENVPPPEQLQFRRAQSADGPEIRVCVACKQPIDGDYFHANGQVVCPNCAQRIESGQQSPPTTSLARAALYGVGAALAGTAIYATVAIVFNLQIGLIAILIGWMVGKSVRYASHGLGGRPQQTLAVLLTYFSITTSYIPVFVYEASKIKHEVKATPGTQNPAPSSETQPTMSPGRAIVLILGLAAAAPFLGLFAGSNPISGLISLFIIFIGLRQAWALTARSEILVMGPYQPNS